MHFEEFTALWLRDCWLAPSGNNLDWPNGEADIITDTYIGANFCGQQAYVHTNLISPIFFHIDFFLIFLLGVIYIPFAR